MSENTVDSLEIVIQSSVEKVNKNIDSLIKKMGIVAKGISAIGNNKGLEEFSETTKTISKNMGDMGIKIKESMKPVQEQAKKISETFEQVKESVKNLDVGKNFKIQGNISDIEKGIKKYTNELEKAKVTEQEVFAKGINTKKYKDAAIDVVKYENMVESLKSQLETINSTKAVAEIQITDTQSVKKSLDYYKKELENSKNDIKSLGEVFGSLSNIPKGMLDTPVENLKISIGELKNSYPQATNVISAFENELQNLQNISKGLTREPIRPNIDFNNVKQSSENVYEKIAALQEKFKDSGKDFKFSGNFQQIENELQKVYEKFNQLKSEEKDMLSTNQVDTSEFERLQEKLAKTGNKLGILEDLRDRTEEFNQSLKQLKVPVIKEDNLGKLQRSLENTETVLDKLKVKLQNNITTGKITENIDDSSYRNLNQQIAESEKLIQALKSKIEVLNKTVKGSDEKARDFHQTLKQLQIPPINESNLGKLQNQLEKTKQKMTSLKTELSNKLTTGQIKADVDDSGYVRMREQIALTGKTINALQEKIQLVSTKTKNSSAEMATAFRNNLKNLQIPEIREDNIDKLQKALEKAEANLDKLKVKLNNDITTGKIKADIDDSGYRRLNQQIAESEKYIEALKQKMQEVGTSTNSVQKSVNNTSNTFVTFKNVMSKLVSVTKSVTSSFTKFVGNGLNKIGSALSSVNSKCMKLASNGFNRLISSMQKSSKSANNLTLSFGTIVKLYAKIRSLTMSFKALGKAIKSSMDFIETFNYFDAAFGQVASNAAANWKEAGYESAEAYAKSFSERARQLTSKMTGFTVSDSGELASTGQKSLGLDPNALMNYQATFAQMSSSMGISSETALKLSNALTEIGADLASVRNLEFEKVWNDMASGLVGMSRSWDKYGVNIRNANLQQKLTELGINANIQALNQDNKALLRTIILLENTEYAWGDLADTLNQPSNQLRLLQSNFTNLSRTIGNLFIPIITQLLPYLNGLVIALQRLFTWIGNVLGIDLSGIGTSIGSSAVDMSQLADETEDATDNLKELQKEAKKTTLGFDQLNILGSNEDEDKNKEQDPSAITAALEGALNDAISQYQKVWDEAFSNMENKAIEIADKIQEAFLGIFETFRKAWSTNGLQVIQSFKTALDNIKSLLQTIGSTFNEVFNSQIGLDWLVSILDLFRSIFDIIGSIAIALKTAWTIDNTGLNFVTQIFKTLTDINNLLITIGDTIANVFNSNVGVEFFKSILDLSTSILNIIDSITIGLKEAWQNNNTGLELITQILKTFTDINNLLTTINNTIANTFSNNTGIGYFKSILELCTSILGVIDSITTSLTTAWQNGSGIEMTNSIFEGFTKINNLLKTIQDSFSRVFSNGTGVEIWENILGIITGVNNTIGNIASQLQKAWETAGLGDGIWQGILDIINSILETFHNIADSTADWAAQLDFTPLLESIKTLLESLQPLTDNIGDGLEWFWNNVLLPMSSWTIEKAIPTFLDMLSASIKALNEVIEALKPLAQWLWDEFLKPLGEWTGNIIIDTMKTITELLNNLSTWISENQETVRGFVITLTSLFAAFKIAGLVKEFSGFIKTAVNIVTSIKSVSGAFSLLKYGIGEIVSALGGPWTIAIAVAIAAIVDLWNTSDTFRNSVIQAFNNVKQSLENAFNRIKDAILPLIDSILNLASSIYDLYDKSPLKAIVALFGTLITTIGGNVISIAIEAISIAFAGLVKVFTGAIDIISGVFDILTGIFTLDFDKIVEGFKNLAKGIQEALSGLLGTFLGLGADIVVGLFKGIVQSIANIGSWIKEYIFDPFIKAFKNIFGIHSPSTVMAEQGKFIMEGLLNGISSLIQKVVDVFTDIKEKVIGAWNNLKENTTQLWQNISSEIGQTWDNLKNVASEKFEAIKESISNAWNNVKTITDEVWNGISEKVKDIWGNLKEFASEKFEAVKETISNAWNNLKSSTEETWNSISDKAKETWDNLKNVAGEKFEAVKEIVSNVWDNLKSSTEETWNGISDKTKETWDNLKSLASEKFGSVKESVSNVWNNLKESTNEVWSNVKGTTENVWNNLKTGANDKFSTIKNYVINAWQSIKQDTSRSWSEIEKAVKGVISNIINVFKEVPSKFVSFGKDIANGVVNGIKNTASSVTSSVRSFAGNVVSTFKSSLGIHSPSKVMAEQGEYVVAGLIQGMEETNPITNWATNIAKELQQTIGNTETWLSDKGKGIIQGFLDGITENGGKINNWFSSLGDQIDEVIPDMSESGKNLFENFISQFKSANISIPNLNLSNAVTALDINTNLVPADMSEFISPLEDPSIISRVNNSSKNYSNSRSSNINEDIKQAVIQGMMEVFMATRENNNQNNAPTIEFTWKTDSETLYKTVQKGKLKSDRRFNVVSEF